MAFGAVERLQVAAASGLKGGDANGHARGIIDAMCGRFVSPEEQKLKKFWNILQHNMPLDFERRSARHNVAPQQGSPDNYIPIVRRNDAGELEVARVQWWL